jgi:hypothetical protein
MYTYGGDATLDGQINIDDYARIDSNANLPGVSGWFNGDFNYDGKINVDDYGIIDVNIGIQGAPFSTTSSIAANSTGGGTSVPLSAASAVPEPTAIATLAFIALLLTTPRARSRRRTVSS